MFSVRFLLLLVSALFLFSSCDKGYDVRFTNLYLEPLDSVLIGDKIVFSGIEVNQTTEYRHVASGKLPIKCISKTKKTFSSEMEIPKNGSGKRTVQIDGLGTIDVFEE